jgi:hypothetical protein
MLSLVVVGLIAIPAMAQTPVSTQYLGPTMSNHSTKALDPPVFLENTYRNNAGWLSWYPYSGLEFVDDIGTIYSGGAKEQMYGTNMVAPRADFLMTGFDVGWFSLDTNTTHIQTMTVNFYDNPLGADYTGESVGTVFVPAPPTLLQSYTVTAANARGAHFDAFDLGDDLTEPDVVMPVDLWMGVALASMPTGGIEYRTGVMLCKDWSGPNPWGFINGGAEYGHSDWWWAAGWNWSQYFNGPPTPTTGAPYYDAYSPRGSFTYSIYGIPEPATLGLLALSGLAMIRRRR